MSKEKNLQAMALTITLKIIVDQLFKNYDQAIVSKDYFTGEFSTNVLKRAEIVLSFAEKLIDSNISVSVAAHIALMALYQMSDEKIDSMNGISPDQVQVVNLSKEHDCDNCPNIGNCPIEDDIRQMRKNDEDDPSLAGKPAQESEEKSDFIITNCGKFDFKLGKN